MAVVLPPLFVAALIWYRRARGWRRAALDAALITGVWVVLLSEALSLFGALRFAPLAAAWCAACLAAGALARSADTPPPRPRARPSDVAFVLALAAFATVTGVVAAGAAPNNWDSMVYHLPRMRHWAAQGHLGLYPSHPPKQLTHPPFGELLQLHLFLLSGGDRFANLVQWLAYLGSIAAASLLAERLGAGRVGQWFAALFCATTPMAILQASNTKNDLLLSLLLLCLALRALDFRPTTPHAAWFGTALGLAALTKGTAPILALPVLTWLVFARRPPERRLTVRAALTIAAVAALLNVAHLWRTASLPLAALDASAAANVARLAISDDGAPTTTTTFSVSGLGGQLVNHAFGIRPFLSNGVRNLAIHLTTPFAAVNRALLDAIEAFHALLGIDASDPRTTYPAWRFYLRAMSRHEDLAGNPVQIALIALALLLFLRRRDRDRDEWAAAIFVGAGAATFSIVLKWQPWHSRLQLPLFLLAAGFVAAQCVRSLPRRAVSAIAAVLVTAAIPYAIANKSRPLVGPGSILHLPRSEQYFANRQDLYSSYRRVVASLRQRHCADVALALGGDDWEYPLWALLDPDGGAGVRLVGADVQNISRSLPPPRGFAPCALVTTRKRYPASLFLGAAPFVESEHTDQLRLFLPRQLDRAAASRQVAPR